MIYTQNKAIGDAGEYFFAYKIAKVLQWPCRLIGIDIGIDAHVEVMGNKGMSTGQFIAFQIKSTTVGNLDYVYVSPENMEYWKNLDLPVFVALVHINQSKIYLHHIDSSADYDVTERGLIRIDFDLNRDRFDKSSGKKLKKAASRAALAHLEAYLDDVVDAAERIQSTIADMKDNPDGQALVDLVHERHDWLGALNQASALVDALGAGATKYQDARVKLYDALEELRCIAGDMNFYGDWDDNNGSLRQFGDENYYIKPRR